jgi:hypothetical protein
MKDLILRPSKERGHSQFDWLDSRFSFSFADYHDPAYMGFRSLRVINEDVIAPSGGFPTHPHRDMEIITYVMAGALQHRDSLGTGAVIRPGEIQQMSAGTGIQHSEFNASDTKPVHMLQIWIIPSSRGGAPAYSQQALDPANVNRRFGLIVSGDGRNSSIAIRQDADLYLAKLEAGQTASFDARAGRGLWMQVAQGSVSVDGTALHQDDGANLNATTPATLTVTADKPSDILLFDMA